MANISSIVRQPNSEVVDVTYNQVVPQHIQGSLDDPAIRQLLMLASAERVFAGRSRRLRGIAGGRMPRRACLPGRGHP